MNMEKSIDINIKDNNRENFLMVKRWLESRNAGKLLLMIICTKKTGSGIRIVCDDIAS